MSEVYEKIGKGVIALPFIMLIAYVMAIYSYMSYGYVIEKTWVWFIPKELIIFQPNYWQSTGIVFMFQILANRSGAKKTDHLKKEYYESSDYVKMQLFAFVAPWFYLLIGYVLKERFFIW